MAERNNQTDTNIPITEFEHKDLLQRVLQELLHAKVEILEATVEKENKEHKNKTPKRKTKCQD